MPQRRSSNQFRHVLGVHRTQAPSSSIERATRWEDDAACIASDPGLFDEPDLEDSSTYLPRTMRRAVALNICAGCAVSEQCLAEAIEQQDTGVIRGGRVFTTKWKGVPPIPKRVPLPRRHKKAGQ